MILLRIKIQKILFGLIFLFLFTPATMAFVLMINSGNKKIEEEELTPVVNFTVKKTKPKKKPENKKVIAKKRPKPKARKMPLVAPLPDLGSSVSGIELDLPGFDHVSFNTSAKSLLGEMKNILMTEDTVDTKPRMIKQAPLKFPKRALAKNISGEVILNFVIDPAGEVRKMRIVEESPLGYGFGDAAAACMAKSIFEPASYKGKPVSLRVTYPVEMKLK